MPTLVLSRRYSEDSNSMRRAALSLGWDAERLMSYSVPEGLAAREPVIYGETLFADAVTESLELTLLEPTHDWLPRLPQIYRKREITLATLGDVRRLTRRAFVKPVDEKLFTARVYERDEEIDPARDFADDNSVLISDAVTWSLEVRAFVLDRTAVTMSAYIRDGEVAGTDDGEWPLSDAERREAAAFLARLLADGQTELPPAVVVDVGVTREHGWAVVEANACWASGICGCDPREVLRALRRASVATHHLTETDRRWSRAAHALRPA